MAVSLKKSQSVSLAKEDPGLKNVLVGLGWKKAPQEYREVHKKSIFGRDKIEKIPVHSTADVDCDAFAILLKDGKFTGSADLIYFAHLKHESESIKHMGDDLVGGKTGDCEQIKIWLNKIPKGYNKIAIGVNIYQAEARKQSFSDVRDAFVRVENMNTGKEICRFDLSNGEYDGKTTVYFGELSLVNGEWTFTAIGTSTTDRSIERSANQFAG